MIRSRLMYLVIFLTGYGPPLAAEHNACNDVGYDWFHLTASELRSVASDCQSEDYSGLNNHRAHYLDLVVENKIIASFTFHSRSGTESNISARLLNMVLIEQLAPYYLPSEIQQLALLNREYEINNNIAESRLRGYTALAKRLDRLESPKK